MASTDSESLYRNYKIVVVIHVVVGLVVVIGLLVVEVAHFKRRFLGKQVCV